MGQVKIVKASAGSGKTFNLAYEYVRDIISEPFQYRHILAVTFTNKATEEMKQRIISEIHCLAEALPTQYLSMLEADLQLDNQTISERAKTARTKILHDYSHFAILTIDKFFQRIIRSFIKELGIDINFNLELQTDTLLSKSADELIDNIATDADLRQWIFDFVEEKIADNKKWDIKEELIKLGKEIFSESYRMAESSVQTREQLKEIVSQSSAKATAIEQTIKQKAIQALQIISQHNLSIDDFAGGRYSFACYFTKLSQGNIVEYGKRVSDALGDDTKWYAKTSPRKADIIAATPKLKPLLQTVCELYDTNTRFLNSVSLLRANYRNFAMLNDLSQKIQEQCIKGNIMPISSTNNILRQLISNNDTPFIFEKAGNHFSKFMIDEFQDTSTMQWENFIPLLENAISQSDQTPVLLVGDIKQSIYRWRGGDWQILAQKVRKQFSDVSNITLDTNYRSLKTVVEFNNNIIAKCIEQDNTAMNTLLNEAREGGNIDLELRHSLTDLLQEAYDGHFQKSKPSAIGGYANITRYGLATDSAGTPPVISRIEELQSRGYAPSDIAILVRFNYEGVQIANMLLDHKSKNPDSTFSYDVVTQEALSIGESDLARFIISSLQLAMNPADSIKLAQYNSWFKRRFDEALPASELAFLNSIRLLPPQEAFEKIVLKYKLGDESKNIAYLQAIHEQVITFGNSTISDIPLFIKWWEQTGVRQSVNIPQSSSAITIISVHKAKGLQYKAVIIPYCNWDLSPSLQTVLWAKGKDTPFEGLERIPIKFKKSVGESYFAEEYYKELILSHIDNINIFYVATTRAERELHLMIPDSKRSTSISALILSSIATDAESARLMELQGRVSRTDDCEIIEFGDPATYKRKQESDNTIINIPFSTFDIGSRMRLRLPSQRYTEAGVVNKLTPRNYGILMHKAFENASTIEDIEQAITLMLQNSTISQAESDNLKAIIDNTLTNPIIKSWFSSEWECVRNENNIIIPKSINPRRPDRVVTKGDRAVVVDYKFGLERSPRYRKQIEEYSDLLHQMGYRNIEGYIWYVSLGDIEHITGTIE